MEYYTFSEISDRLFFHGRHTEENGMPAFDWTNSGLSVSFRADRAAVSFGPYSDECPLTGRKNEPAYVKAILDGRASKYAITNGRERIVFDDLGGGTHTLKLTRITESANRLAFEGITLYGGDEEIIAAKAPSGPKIEVLGDSVICGHGILSPYERKEYVPFEDDSSVVFTEMVSDALDADTRYVAASGEGAAFKYDGTRGKPICEYFHYESRSVKGEHDFSSWVPDIVVTELGGNDQSVIAPDVYLPEFDRFVRDIRKCYPDVPIIWMYPMMYNDYHAEKLEELLAGLNKELGNIHYIKTTPAYEDEFACGAHPNIVSHRRFAAQLLEKINEILADR